MIFPSPPKTLCFLGSILVWDNSERQCKVKIVNLYGKWNPVWGTNFIFPVCIIFCMCHVFNTLITSNSVFLAREKLMGEWKKDILWLWATYIASNPEFLKINMI